LIRRNNSGAATFSVVGMSDRLSLALYIAVSVASVALLAYTVFAS
jgi:hypothetical protein